MAEVTIGDLTAATSVDGTELLEIEQGGSTKSVTAAEIAALGGGGTGDAMYFGFLAQFGSTTSAELAGVISDETGTGALVFADSPILVTPDLGTPSSGDLSNCTGVASGNDGNDNYTANNFLSSYATHVTAAGTTTLTIASPYQQYFTGSTTQNCKLPVASTLTLGHRFFIANSSTGTVTVQSSGSNTVVALATDESAMVTCILASGTSAASWSVVTAGAGSVVDDTAYDATTWNGDTTNAPSKNAVRDKIESLTLGGGNVSSSGTPTSGQLATWASASTVQGATTGTGVVTALGVNTNATGGFITVDGSATLTNKTLTSPTLTTPVLGTPSSGTLTSCTVDGTNLLGYRGIPQNSQTAAYTTVLSDAGKVIFHPSSDNNARTFTIDSNANVAYVIGTVIEFINMAAASATIAITSDTMTLLPAGTTGSRTLAQYGRANAEKIASTEWVISGNSALT